MGNPLFWAYDLVGSCISVPAFVSLIFALFCLASVVVAWWLFWEFLHV